MIPYNKNYLKCLSCLFLEYSSQYFQVPVDHKKPKPLEVKLWLRRDCYTAQPLSQWNCVLQLPIPPGTARLGSRQTPGLHVLRPLPSSHSFPYSLESTSPASRETELLTVHASTMPGTSPFVLRMLRPHYLPGTRLCLQTPWQSHSQLSHQWDSDCGTDLRRDKETDSIRLTASIQTCQM